MPRNTLIQCRNGTYAAWDAQSSVILSSGEPGFITDFNKLKIGDGVTEWSDLTAVNDNITTMVINKTANTIPKMSVVYINGAQGDLPSITLSIASGESSSSKTYGITTGAIAPNDVGQVVVDGALKNLNTLTQFSGVSPGTTLWLSPTISGGITVTKPYAPYHMVSLGNLIRVHQNQGVINVSIQNGFELEELHNVATTGATNGQFLQYNNSSGLWMPSSSGNFTSLSINNTGVSVSGHTHTSSDIINFNSSVSGLINVKDIIAGSNVTISNNNGIFIVSSTGSGGGANPVSRGAFLLTSSSGTFDVSGGYTVGSLDVFLNGVKLFASGDYTASNGTSFTLTTPAPSGSVIEYLSLVPGTNFFGGGNDNIVGTGISNHIAYWNSSSGIVADSGQLYWDSVNNRLGIGTSTPSTKLHAEGDGKFNGNLTVNSGIVIGDLQNYLIGDALIINFGDGGDKLASFINGSSQSNSSINLNADTTFNRLNGAGSLPFIISPTGYAGSGAVTQGFWRGSTIEVNKGGTGRTTYSNGQLLIGSGTSLVANTLTAGTGISITNGSGTITINTSGLQTALANPVTGTGVANHIPYWSSTSGLLADSNQLVWDNTNNRLGLGTNAPTNAIHIAGFNTSNSQLRVGNLEFQPYALNNAWIGENVYFNGSNFFRRQTGAAGLFYFQGTEGQFRFDTSAGTGVPVTSNPVWKIIHDGSMGVGQGMDFSTGSLANAKFIVNNSGDVGINTTQPSAKLHVNGSVNLNNLITINNSNTNITNPIFKYFSNEYASFVAGYNSYTYSRTSGGNTTYYTNEDTSFIEWSSGDGFWILYDELYSPIVINYFNNDTISSISYLEIFGVPNGTTETDLVLIKSDGTLVKRPSSFIGGSSSEESFVNALIFG